MLPKLLIAAENKLMAPERTGQGLVSFADTVGNSIRSIFCVSCLEAALLAAARNQ
jgi:hypothetical protein